MTGNEHCRVRPITTGNVVGIKSDKVCELEITLIGSDHDPVVIVVDRKLTVEVLCLRLTEIFTSALSPDGEHVRLRTWKGATLAGHWVIGDIMPDGGRLQAHSQLLEKPILQVCRTYAKDSLFVYNPIDIHLLPVEEVKAIIANRTGIPSSVFRLMGTVPKSERRQELYNGHILVEYGIQVGSVIWMEVWDGWVDYLLAVEHKSGEALVASTLSFIKKEPVTEVAEYKQRVALCVAAFQGYLPLATRLVNLSQSVSPAEPVGVHPCKGWYIGNFTPCDANAPIHSAALQGHIAIIRLFTQICPRCLVVEDANGLTALDLAKLAGHKQCVEFIMAQTQHWQTAKTIHRATGMYRPTQKKTVLRRSQRTGLTDTQEGTRRQVDSENHLLDTERSGTPAQEGFADNERGERRAAEHWSKALISTARIPGAIRRMKRGRTLSAKRRKDEPKFSPEEDFAKVGIFRDESGLAKSHLGADIFIDGIHDSFQNSKTSGKVAERTRRKHVNFSDARGIKLPPIQTSWREGSQESDDCAYDKFISAHAQEVFHLHQATKKFAAVYEEQCASGKTLRELAKDSINMAGAVCGSSKSYLLRLGQAVEIARRAATRRAKAPPVLKLPSCSQVFSEAPKTDEAVDNEADCH